MFFILHFPALIDVGGVFAFRLQDSVSTLPELAWKNIFTPGIGATLRMDFVTPPRAWYVYPVRAAASKSDDRGQ
ncbi:hypothetical protein [Spirosoma pulveris]